MVVTAQRGRMDAPTVRPAFVHVLHSEWIKFFSLPSIVLGLAGIILFGVGGSLFLGVTLESSGVPSEFSAERTMADVTVSAVVIGQIIAGVIGVLVIGTEYTSGSVQPTFVAVPDRLRVLSAKAIVAGVACAIAGAFTVFTAWAVNTPIYAQFGLDVQLTTPGVLQVLAGSALYLGLCSMFGVGVGTLVRSTTAGSIIVFLATLVFPIAVSLLPFGIVSRFLRIIQLGNAGDAMSRINEVGAPFLDVWTGHISFGAGSLIAVTWAALALIAGAVVLQAKDV